MPLKTTIDAKSPEKKEDINDEVSEKTAEDESKPAANKAE